MERIRRATTWILVVPGSDAILQVAWVYADPDTTLRGNLARPGVLRGQTRRVLNVG